MNKYLLHILIYIISLTFYIHLNNLNISPFNMCHLLIKIICCNKSISDKDLVYDPDNITVPFDDIKKVGSAIENVVEDVIQPQNKIVKSMVDLFSDKKKN